MIKAALLATAALLIARSTPPSPPNSRSSPTVQSLRTPTLGTTAQCPAMDAFMYKAQHGKEGIDRIVDSLITSLRTDPRTADIFRASDFERLHRTLAARRFLLRLRGALPLHRHGYEDDAQGHGPAAAPLQTPWWKTWKTP